jgi:Tol biopolymer transport system component
VGALVIGASPPGNPYEAWTRGEPPETTPGWESVFGSTELRRHPDIDITGTWVTYDQPVDGERAIYRGQLTGASSVRLTRGHIDHNPVFSPNGQRIAFARDDDRIMVINLNGTELLEFGTELGVVNTTDWGPSGDRLLFDADGDIYELDLTLNRTRHLAGEPVDQWGAVYSPDGSRIYYISYEAAGRNPEIWSMGPDGSGHKQLTFNDLMERFVSVSPNGNKVAFTIEDGTATGDRLCVMNPDGSEVRTFTDRSRNVYLLRWLPDGEGLLAEVSGLDAGIHDLGRVDYPWSDAGFRTDDDNGGGSGGGASLWDGLDFLSPLLRPVPCLVIIAVVAIIGYSYRHVRRSAREREEKAAKLKQITGRKDDAKPSTMVEQVPETHYPMAQPYSYDDGYDRRWR